MADFDAIIIGGGIGGSALGAVLARDGRRVLVLERTTQYRDMVRGEWISPWGVVETKRLGLYETLLAAGGHHVARHVEFGDDIDPEAAIAQPLQLGAFLPGIPGPLCIGHPTACDALEAEAARCGATVLRGVTETKVQAGAAPAVEYAHQGTRHTATASLVVGADGRNSTTRGQLGIEVHQDPQHHWFSGLLVEGADDWPDDLETMGTEGDVQFFVFPQGQGRLRLYLGTAIEQKSRLAGADAPQRFLQAFRLATMPGATEIAEARVAGPCNAFPNNDTWTDRPCGEGAVLIGDAAGHNDPITGQGLSITMRDVRIVSDTLRGTETSTWGDPALFDDYAAERSERMRRLRFSASLDSILHAEFGERARRRRAAARECNPATRAAGAGAADFGAQCVGRALGGGDAGRQHVDAHA